MNTLSFIFDKRTSKIGHVIKIQWGMLEEVFYQNYYFEGLGTLKISLYCIYFHVTCIRCAKWLLKLGRKF